MPRQSIDQITVYSPMAPSQGAVVAATTTKKTVDLSAYVGSFCSVKSQGSSAGSVYVLCTDAATDAVDTATGVTLRGDSPDVVDAGERLEFVIDSKNVFLQLKTVSDTATVYVSIR